MSSDVGKATEGLENQLRRIIIIIIIIIINIAIIIISIIIIIIIISVSLIWSKTLMEQISNTCSEFR